MRHDIPGGQVCEVACDELPDRGHEAWPGRLAARIGRMLFPLRHARFRDRVPLILAALALSLLAPCRPAQADDGPRSAEDVRVQQALQAPVGDAPLARLYVAEVVAALGQTATADALRAALLERQWRALDGGAADPAATLGSLLPPTPQAFPLGPESAAANAWSTAVRAHLRLRFLDAQASAAHPLAEADRAGRAEVAPGMWVSSAPVGSMVLFVRAHQEPQARLVLTRLHVTWLGAHLECAPVQGLAAREQDALLSCEGNSRAAEQAPRVRAVTNSPASELVGDVRPGEFDSPRATSAWIDVLGAGHETELKALLRRSAPCENAADAASRCQSKDALAARAEREERAAQAAAYKAQAAEEAKASTSRLSSDDLAKVLSWFFAGAVVSWLICAILPTRSIVLTVLIHVGVTVVLAIVAWRGGFLAWAIYSNANREQSAVSALFGLAIYGVVALGIVVGGFAHLVRRIVAMLRDGPIWA